MKKVTKKTTIEEFNKGELVKRTVEETIEEIENNSPYIGIATEKLPRVGEKLPGFGESPWCRTTRSDDIQYLTNTEKLAKRK